MMLATSALALALALPDAPAAAVVTQMTPTQMEQAIQEGRVKAKSGLLAGLFGKVSFPGQYPQGGRKKAVLTQDALHRWS